jgi:hypothetical protein
VPDFLEEAYVLQQATTVNNDGIALYLPWFRRAKVHFCKGHDVFPYDDIVYERNVFLLDSFGEIYEH